MALHNLIEDHLLELTLPEQLNNKIVCITVENACSNIELGLLLEESLPAFNHQEHFLGCVGHVIKLSAKNGILFIKSG